MTVRARGARRRGATFVIVTLIASLVLLGTGGALVDATTAVARQSAFRERQDRANEALSGAADWARAEVARWDESRERSSATLRFFRATVAISLSRRDDGTVLGTASAKAPPDGESQCTFALARRDGRWVVARYELAPVARPTGARKTGAWR